MNLKLTAKWKDLHQQAIYSSWMNDHEINFKKLRIEHYQERLKIRQQKMKLDFKAQKKKKKKKEVLH